MYRDSYNNRKKYYITLFVSIYVVIFICCALLLVANWNAIKQLFKKKQTQPVVDQTAYNQLFDKVRYLEKLSKQFNENNYQLRTVEYIRSVKYNNSTWSRMDIGDKTAFEAYVLANEGDSAVSELKNLGSDYTFIVPATGEVVDFYHMFATLNSLIYVGTSGFSVAAGWGGDICQLAADYKDKKDDFANYAALKDSVSNAMMSLSSFGTEDRNADIDAVNIYNIYFENPYAYKSVSSAISIYYLSTTKKEQNNLFIESLGIDNLTTQVREQVLYNKLQSNIYIQTLSNTYGFKMPKRSESVDLDLNSDAGYKEAVYRACIKAFIDCLYE